MSGHGPIYDFRDYPSKDLTRALHLMDELEDLGFEQDSELIFAIQSELEERAIRFAEEE